MSDLFEHPIFAESSYSAKDIEILEGLEPVRRRPSMYIGGTDQKALHHLAAEVLDNAMDEAVAGFASWIEASLNEDGSVSIRDNGRGIPVDPHPKYPGTSALEIIMTTLHSGGKFGSSAYKVAGGLHGVGVSVVNALSERMTVEVARDRKLWTQSYSRGQPLGPLTLVGPVQNRRGTTISFSPDPEIFRQDRAFDPGILYHMARSKAYLYRGVEIRWNCAPPLLKNDAAIPAQDSFRFPNGLSDYLSAVLADRPLEGGTAFCGQTHLPDDAGNVEWAVAWPIDQEGFSHSYCNTIPTTEGGSHDAGFKSALLRGVRQYAEMVGNRRAGQIAAEDIAAGACLLLSLFIKNPAFQNQTKEKLVTPEARSLVENAVKDHFDHWLSGDPAAANALLERILERAEDRLRKKQDKETARKSATKRLRLPGKLTDCTRRSRIGAELFLVEGDSAGGSAKQGRDREIQAVLPLRGKILNVASATEEKMRANQELKDLIEALGCGVRKSYTEEKLRYDRVIIMTDADVDGAHIATLLMTFFYREMPDLIRQGHLFLACPPLYRISHGQKTVYARDDAHKDALLSGEFANKKVEISRFKGLGEMPPHQLKETTMNPKSRTLLRVVLPEEEEDVRRVVEDLMGRKPELRFRFIQERARFARDLDI
ncbi:DNA topoisomerase 4 subunit B [Alphaproteobacteria bacterium]|nr:DNA topoisomerase 4 subunit B [Alphaproteobacteria bacterium]